MTPAVPRLTPAQALRRLADEDTLLLLHGGASGMSYLAWGAHAVAEPWTGGELAPWLDRLASPRGDDTATDDDDGWCGFAGGAFVQLDYESPRTPPRAWRVSSWAGWDRAGRCTLHGAAPEALAADLARPEREIPLPRPCSPLAAAWDARGHAERVERIRSYIAAGDIYQANLTVPFAAELASGRDADIAAFIALSESSPAPFSALLRAPGRDSVVSHSPECFLRARGRCLASLPIKGTRRRVPGAEARVRAELLASPKERAELAMIVDLVRNDLGRVAEPGSVAVADAARLLDLPYAHHLLGVVTARLRAASSLGEAVAAAFPAGSITGAPKRRAMQIIAVLERGPRGPYCGAFGWVGRGGCDLAVAIRTLVIGPGGARLHAGSGIVADSDARAEWEETCLKAEAMARAVGGSL